jgi:hypothetical protein
MKLMKGRGEHGLTIARKSTFSEGLWSKINIDILFIAMVIYYLLPIYLEQCKTLAKQAVGRDLPARAE